ncbi:MAG: hypothetical protein K2Z81_07970 [Cyanobacteria bacterium]|nr:hypothetical protein [Cyanobacteriota bacterium]
MVNLWNAWIAMDAEDNLGVFSRGNHNKGLVPTIASREEGLVFGLIEEMCRLYEYDLSELLAQPEDIGPSRPLPSRVEDCDKRIFNDYFQQFDHAILLVDQIIFDEAPDLIPLRGDKAFAAYTTELDFWTAKDWFDRGLASKMWVGQLPDPARIGCFLFDYSPAIFDTGEPYQRIATPRNPLKLSQLPESIRQNFARVRFGDTSFSSDESIWLRRFFQSNKSFLEADGFENYWYSSYYEPRKAIQAKLGTVLPDTYNQQSARTIRFGSSEFIAKDSLIELFLLELVRQIDSLQNPGPWLQKLRDVYFVKSADGFGFGLYNCLTDWVTTDEHIDLLMQLIQATLTSLRSRAPDFSMEGIELAGVEGCTNPVPTELVAEVATQFLYLLEAKRRDSERPPTDLPRDLLAPGAMLHKISLWATVRDLNATGLPCYTITIQSATLKSVRPVEVSYLMDLSGCFSLTTLPDDLCVPYLILRNCTSLTCLPENLSVDVLDISGCTGIVSWPRQGEVRGRFIARGCNQITDLPPWLTQLSQLDVSGCTSLTRLPPDLVVTSGIDVGDSGLTALPEACRKSPVLWRGMLVDERSAFHPELITASEVLAESNAEIRRFKLARMGHERFMQEADAIIVDSDTDAGGERQLLRVPMPDDEDFLCLSVICPSTGRRFILRVPPDMNTCRGAVAWTFDLEDDYNPSVES